MQVVIPCGGLGTRLRPLTEDTPKSMVWIRGKPFLAWQIAWLKEHGVDEVILCIGHLGEQIQDYFKDGTDYDVTIKYAQDDHLDVYGAVKEAKCHLDDTFMLLYGDSYPVHLDIKEFWQHFNLSPSLMSIAAYKNHDHIDKSNLKIQGGTLIDVDCRDANAIDIGATMLSRAALNVIPDDIPVSTADMRQMIHANNLLDAYLVDTRFYHIGNHHALQETMEVLK